MKENILRLLRYVLQREETEAVRLVKKMNVIGKGRGRGRPKKRW